jgi:Holliday junction resolvase
MNVPNNRARGARGERELCNLFTDALGFNVSRRLGQARDSGHDIDLPGFDIEVKKRRKIALLYEALGQAESGSGTPVVASRADGKDWLVTMYLTDWIKLAREEIIAALADEKANGR